MRKGQTGIGLVILGVVAIIAVIGLVLLFTRASKTEGALLTDLSIGNIYGGGQQSGTEGIAITYPASQRAAGAPPIAYPYSKYGQYPTAVVRTKGTRKQAFIVSAKSEGDRRGYATIADVYGCEWSLITGAKFGVPHDMFNCYQVPNYGPSVGAEGFFPPDSAAEVRAPKDARGNYGGDVYCYANSFGAEQQIPDSEDRVRENILNAVRQGTANVGDYEWTEIDGIPVCWISQKAFPFPQGTRT